MNSNTVRVARRAGLLSLALLWSGLGSGCTGYVGPEPKQVDRPLAVMGPAALPDDTTDGGAERLVMSAVACWMGNLWSDAVRGPDPLRVSVDLEGRAASTTQRCRQIVLNLYGADDRMRYQQLRAADPVVVDALADRVRSVAEDDRRDRGQGDALTKLLRAAATAARENILARGPADDVKRDEMPSSRSTFDERTQDKTIAARALLHTEAIQALFALDAGRFTHEAHAVGLLCALDRLEIARKLPKHLKVYAVGGPFQPIFGVLPPVVPEDPASPIRTGTWPGYLADVAAAAGHAVPAAALEPIDRESLAWGGVLQGLSDRLRAESVAVSSSTPLPSVLRRAADRLDGQYATLQALFRSEQARR
jgi:hypothetical protein